MKNNMQARINRRNEAKKHIKELSRKGKSCRYIKLSLDKNYPNIIGDHLIPTIMKL